MSEYSETVDQHLEVLGPHLRAEGIALQRVDDHIEFRTSAEGRARSMRVTVFLDLAECLSRLGAWSSGSSDDSSTLH